MISGGRAVSLAPRSYLFQHCVRSARQFSSTLRHRSENSPKNSSFGGFGGPAPPRLPKEDQEIFEALQKQSTGAFSTPRAPPRINQSPNSSAADRAEAETIVSNRTNHISGHEKTKLQDEFDKVIEARGKGEELHPNVRRGATPEFEGDVNPKTGEVGGPKNEPLRWGAAGEWSYNGRTTDF